MYVIFAEAFLGWFSEIEPTAWKLLQIGVGIFVLGGIFMGFAMAFTASREIEFERVEGWKYRDIRDFEMSFLELRLAERRQQEYERWRSRELDPFLRD